MTSSTQSGQDDGVLTPDSAPTPDTVFGASLSRVARFCQYARAHTSSDLIFHQETPGDPVQLFGVDLAVVIHAATAWGELLPLVHDGLVGRSRAAIDRIGAYGQRYDAVRSAGTKYGPVVSSIDSTSLNFDDVAHIAFLLDFVDQVAKHNPISAVTPVPAPFNDTMLDVFQAITAQMPESDMEGLVKRARMIWPEITSSVVSLTLTALAARTMHHMQHASESAS